MAREEKIYIIGMGDDGLKSITRQAQDIIRDAEVLVGAESTLRFVPADDRERYVVGKDLEELVEHLAARAGRKIVVLASGDPLFYGVARYLCNRLGKQRFEVLPHVSSMQLAFARVKESWEEAYLTNLATRPIELVAERIRVSEKVGLFTSEEYPPKAVARALLDRGIDYFWCYICENLGSPDERVTQAELSEVAGMDFASLNCMVLVRKPSLPDRPTDALGKRLFGNPDEVFAQSKPKRGLLTPSEVRAIALSELDLGPTSILWDVGAGSGSLAIEAAQIASGGVAYAIEMDAEDHAVILANAEKFGVQNLSAILGRAPEAWQNLPDPDAVFVGGTGRDVAVLVSAAYERLRPGGRLVTHLGSIENLVEIHAHLLRCGAEPKVWMLNLARGTYQLERIRFESLNPSFLVAIVKPA